MEMLLQIPEKVTSSSLRKPCASDDVWFGSSCSFLETQSVLKSKERSKKKSRKTSRLTHMQQAGRCEWRSTARRRIQRDQREKITADRKLPGQAWLQVKCPHATRSLGKEAGPLSGALPRSTRGSLAAQPVRAPALCAAQGGSRGTGSAAAAGPAGLLDHGRGRPDPAAGAEPPSCRSSARGRAPGAGGLRGGRGSRLAAPTCWHKVRVEQRRAPAPAPAPLPGAPSRPAGPAPPGSPRFPRPSPRCRPSRGSSSPFLAAACCEASGQADVRGLEFNCYSPLTSPRGE